MKISTKGRYALRLMLDLAVNYSESYISLKAVAQRQFISDKYLEQIITPLNKAGFVLSARGAQGGYRLSRKPKDYTVGEILRAVEGSLAPVTCLEEGNSCANIGSCITVGLYRRIQESVNNVVDHTTLEDLVADHKAKQI